MKYQVINFRDFMSEDYKITRKLVPYNVLATSLITPAYGLIPSSLIAKGYLVVIGAGLFCMALFVLENIAVSKEYEVIAESIISFMKLFVPLTLIALLIAFVYFNPLL
jgi:hypothetical protein